MNEFDDITVKNSAYVNLKRVVDDSDGCLCIINGQQDVPFEIKRVYYINSLDVASSVRGKHAHRKLRQVIFCISGSFVLSLDDGINKQDIRMWRDNVGVVLDPMLWHTMHSFSIGCVIMVVASDYYNESDYIRNYDEFIKLSRESK
ncbi:MAG: FdtA/QdtA family cupin domain-containing protein [Victivallales bacterium]|nr:FdtA/QdtA family cupin domain-containing protein [Victivallales bacterium]